MARLEQFAALVLAAALAIPSYWFFWTMAGGGGYDRRGTKNIPSIEEKSLEVKPKSSQSINRLEP